MRAFQAEYGKRKPDCDTWPNRNAGSFSNRYMRWLVMLAHSSLDRYRHNFGVCCNKGRHHNTPRSSRILTALTLPSTSLPQLLKVLRLLSRQFATHVPDNRQYQRIIIRQESIPLTLIRNPLPQLGQERFELAPQPSQTARDGFVVAGLAAQGQYALRELTEPLRQLVRRRGLLGRVGQGQGGGGAAGGDGGADAAQGVAVGVHCDLEAGPEQHVGAVDVAVRGGDFPSLQLEGRVLVQTHAEQDAEAIVGAFDQLFCQGPAEGEGRFEDGGEALGY